MFCVTISISRDLWNVEKKKSEPNKHKCHLHCQKIPCVDFHFAGTWPQNLSPNAASQKYISNLLKFLIRIHYCLMNVGQQTKIMTCNDGITDQKWGRIHNARKDPGCRSAAFSSKSRKPHDKSVYLFETSVFWHEVITPWSYESKILTPILQSDMSLFCECCLFLMRFMQYNKYQDLAKMR